MNSIVLPQSHTVQFGSKKIDFDLFTSNRKTLGISVYPDLRVTVTVPTGALLDKVEQKVKKKAPWIIRKKLFFSDFLPLSKPKEFRSGESFYYLGRQYRLKVSKSKNQSIKLNGKILEVFTSKKNDLQKNKKIIEKWYLEKASNYLNKRFEYCISKYFGNKQIKTNKLVIRRMQNRWGSFTPSKSIILNPELVRLPSHCIDYVIVHEICHLSHKNHGKDFFKLLGQIMPDWNIRKGRLVSDE